jgi:ribose 5-phosphate isomerase
MFEDKLTVSLSRQFYIIVDFKFNISFEFSYITVPVEFLKVGMPQCLKGSKPLRTAKTQQIDKQINGLLVSTQSEDLPVASMSY